MLGAITGDFIGSFYEWNNVKRKDFPLVVFSPEGGNVQQIYRRQRYDFCGCRNSKRIS